MPMTTEEIDTFLSEPILGVLSTVDGDGHPRQAPLWYHWEDGGAYIFTGRGTLKWRNLQSDPHASLCVDRREPPYAYVLIEGSVEESDRSLYELVLAMALRYYGEEQGPEYAKVYADDENMVVLRLTPERVVSWVQDDYPPSAAGSGSGGASADARA
jgi:PPOX class probable F420-dependent enzyme